jgi:hypothetical protein
MRKLIAFMRIWVWGFCPYCNSDAPDLYDCPVCNYDTKSPFGFIKRRKYWLKYKKYLKR